MARDIPQILLLLGHFVIKKLLIKNCSHFVKNFMRTLKLSFKTFWNFSEDVTHWKNFQILIRKTLKILYFEKKCTVFEFSKIIEFYLPLNQRVLTKCWLKYSRSIQNLLLMFFIFCIMIISPKLKKIFDGTDPPKKFEGYVPSNIFFIFGDMIMIQNMKKIQSKFRIDLEYFDQHLVNTGWFSDKSNSRILEKS